MEPTTIDIADAAHKLWAEMHDELIRSGDEYGDGPCVRCAWDRYVDSGAHKQDWWTGDDSELNDIGLAWFERFEAAFENGAGIYGMLHGA